MIGRRRFLAVAAAFAAMPVEAGGVLHRWRGRALGADAEIVLRGPAESAAAAMTEVRAVLDEIEQTFSLFRDDSAVQRLNGAGMLADVPPMLAAILPVADMLWRATVGAFDPTVQPLWRALARGQDPAAAHAAIGWERVQWGDGPIVLGQGQGLTFNGVAQGYATDRVSGVLAAHGFDAALVSAGEQRALGGPWRLGVQDPDHGVIGLRTLSDSAIATSSPGAMALGAHGHILSPAGGRPHWSTVSVEAETAVVADGASTALCLVDRAQAAEIAARLPGLRRVTLVSPNGDVTTL